MMRFLVAALIAFALPASAAERIVVAGGDLTEIIFALGAGERVVGVDLTSTFPAETGDLPQIGYVRKLSAEGVLSLRPDLVIAAHDAGPSIALEQLAAAGVEIATAPPTPSAWDIAEKIQFVGDELGVASQARNVAAQFTADLEEVLTKVDRLPERPRVLFILSIRGGALLAAGRDTQAHEIVTLSGGENVAASFDGFKPMNREAVLAARPEVIVMMAQHAERSGGIDTILARPELALTPAGQNGRAITMDGMLLLGFGPRTPQAIAELAARLQPEAAEAAGL
ncbi:MAG: ABC transporter substrate-binding protein [Pseudomonadota bacterium]